MSPPWDKYALPSAPGPWAKYEPAPSGGVQDWEPSQFTAGDKAARAVGVTAQGASDALYGTALAPLDVSGWAAKKLGLVNPDAEPPSRTVTNFLASIPGRIGLASKDAAPRIEPAGSTERTLQGLGEGVGNALSIAIPAGAVAGATRAGTAANSVANTLASRPILQATAGGVGGAVTGYTDNPGYGMGAAIAVPVAVSAAEKGLRTMGAMVQPFRKEGQDRIVGNALNTLADDPKAAISNMETYTPPVEGFKLSAAKAARDDSLLAAENAMNRAGTGFGQQANANNAALSSALAKLDAGGDVRDFVAVLAKQDAAAAARAQAALDALPPNADAASTGMAIQNALRGRYDALIAARKQAADPLYAAARNSSQPVNPWELMTKTADLVAANKGEPQAVMQKVRDLLFNPDGTPDRTARGMMATRNAVNAMLDNQNLDNYSRSLLQDVKAGIDTALSVVPEEQQARAVFAKASVPLEPFDPKLGNRNVASTIAKDQYNKNFLADPGTVPGRFFRPGEGGGATMRELLDAQPGQGAIDAMTSYAGGKAREAGNIGGFADRYSSSINALSPRLADNLNEAGTTNVLAKGYRASPAGRFVTGDADAAMRSTLGAPDSGNRMLALRGAVTGDAKATAGLQKGILDDFRSSALSKVAEDADGNPRMIASGVEAWLKSNRDTAAKVLTPDQMAGLESISRALKEQSRSAVKVAGSDTGRNLATQNILDSLLWQGAGEKAIMHPLRKALGLVYGGANDQIADRLAEVMLDPKVAAALMRKATPASIDNAVSLIARQAPLAARAGSDVETENSRRGAP